MMKILMIAAAALLIAGCGDDEYSARDYLDDRAVVEQYGPCLETKGCALNSEELQEYSAAKERLAQDRKREECEAGVVPSSQMGVVYLDANGKIWGAVNVRIEYVDEGIGFSNTTTYTN